MHKLTGHPGSAVSPKRWAIRRRLLLCNIDLPLTTLEGIVAEHLDEVLQQVEAAVRLAVGDGQALLAICDVAR